MSKKPEIVNISSAKADDLPDIVLENAKGKYYKILIIGWTDSNDPQLDYDVGSASLQNLTTAEIVHMIEATKFVIFTNSTEDAE